MAEPLSDRVASRRRGRLVLPAATKKITEVLPTLPSKPSARHRSSPPRTKRVASGGPPGWGSPPAFNTKRFYEPVGLALILLTTFVAYLPALQGARLWDDDAHITKPELQSLQGLYRIWFELGATQQYYPFLHSAFWLEHKLWGDSVLGYHLVNVLLHVTSVVLVYFILKRLKIPGALLAAAIFAVHPVMVESVAWITEQKNTLSGLFYLSAMLVYLQFDESRQRSLYFLAMALFVLGLLTKTVIATLPAALLVIFWWQRGTISWKRDVLPLLPFFLLGAAGGLTTAIVERTLIGAEGAEFEMSILQRGVLAGRVIWFYLAKLLWPANLIFIYRRWNIDSNEIWQWLFPITTLATTVVLWTLRKQTRGLLAGWLLFVGTLFPVLGFLNAFPFIFSFVADHFQYLASLGIIVLVAAAIATGAARLAGSARTAAQALCVLLIGTLAYFSWRQSTMYADAITLYQTTIDRNPECWMALNNLGQELVKSGKPQDTQNAIECYRSALRFRPDYPQALNSLGFALTQLGRPQEALELIERAIRLRPDYIEANLNLAIALRKLGRNEEAIRHIKYVLQVQPENADARTNLGNLYIYMAESLHSTEMLQKGIDELQLALAQKPDNPAILTNLGNALMSAGRTSEAIEHFEQAVRKKPDYAQAHNSLGLALASIGRTSQAIEHFEQAVRKKPDYAKAHCNLGDVFRQIGQLEQAIEHYQAAVRIRPNDMQAYANLAQTLALLKRSQEAVAVSEKAIELARSTGQKDELEQFEEWLKNYRKDLQRAANDAPPTSPPHAQEPTKSK
jgi:tetratricopeptide (TPR) repeat protein